MANLAGQSETIPTNCRHDLSLPLNVQNDKSILGLIVASTRDLIVFARWQQHSTFCNRLLRYIGIQHNDPNHCFVQLYYNAYLTCVAIVQIIRGN